MSPKCPRFVVGSDDLDRVLLHAKQYPCRYCGRAGTLIGHGVLLGYAERGNDRVVRGRRLLCSNRHRRAGCGRTWSVRLGSVIAGFCVRTGTLSRMLVAAVAASSTKSAWRQQSPGLSVRSGYRLWRRLHAAGSHLRTLLCTASPPPSCHDRRPFVQLLLHLRQALGTARCELETFQLAFQRHLLG